MAFWSKKKNKDALIKYLNEQNVNHHEEHGCVTFELSMKNGQYSIYPYIRINETMDELSILVNLRNVVEKSKEYSKLAAFNEKSKFFVAKIRDAVLVLEYNCYATYELVERIIAEAFASLCQLEEEIDAL